MKTFVRHIGIFVDNLEQMKSFYMNCFDLKEKAHVNEGGNYLETFLGVKGIALENYKLQDPNGLIVELLKTDEEYGEHHFPQVCHKGCLHLAMTVQNVNEIYSRLKTHGGDPIAEPIVSPDGNAKVCFGRDPEGNYLELVEEL